MTCEVCGAGRRQEQLIRYTLTLEDRVVVVDHVPASVCDHCVETTLKPEVVERLQNMVWSDQAPVRRLEASVYEYA